MLHYLDDLDSKMESMRAQFERESEMESAWTSYNTSLARPLLNTKKFLEKGLAAVLVVEPPKSTEAASSPEETTASSEARPETSLDDGQPSSSLDALERKFSAHKVTPIKGKAN